MTVCGGISMSVFFLRASLPQRMNTTESVFAATTRITSSVNVSHPFWPVRARRPFAHCQYGVEEQHSSARPRFEASVVGDRHAHVIVQLAIDVPERRWHPNAMANGEGQAMRLAGARVRVLAEDHRLGLGGRREMQRGEDLVVGWVYAVA